MHVSGTPDAAPDNIAYETHYVLHANALKLFLLMGLYIIYDTYITITDDLCSVDSSLTFI